MEKQQNYQTSVAEKLAKMMQGTGYVSKANPHIYRPKTRSAEEHEKNPEYIRVLPYKDYPDPFLELYYHYNIGASVLCPEKTPYVDFDGECPICEYVNSLMKTDFKSAIQKAAQIRVHIPIVVRGDEFNKDGTPNIKFWGIPSSYNPKRSRELPIYMEMLKAVNNADIGKFWDPIEGTDIEVICLKTTEDKYSKPKIDFRRRTNKLSAKQDEIDMILESVPDWKDVIEVPTMEMLHKSLEKWINSLKEKKEPTGKPQSISEDLENDDNFEDDEQDMEDMEKKLDQILRKTN